MNKIVAMLLILPTLVFGQSKHKGMSNVKVVKAVTQSVLGRSFGYYVVFKNNSNRPVDGIKWKATFTNNFGEVLGVKNGTWQSGNFLLPIKPGGTTQDIEKTYVKGGLKIRIAITKVHFAEELN